MRSRAAASPACCSDKKKEWTADFRRTWERVELRHWNMAPMQAHRVFVKIRRMRILPPFLSFLDEKTSSTPGAVRTHVCAIYPSARRRSNVVLKARLLYTPVFALSPISPACKPLLIQLPRKAYPQSYESLHKHNLTGSLYLAGRTWSSLALPSTSSASTARGDSPCTRALRTPSPRGFSETSFGRSAE